MNVQECVAKVNNLCYRPGWKFEAEVYPNNVVIAIAFLTTPDSDSKYAPDFTGRILHNMPVVQVFIRPDVEDWTDVRDRIFCEVLKAELHKEREFFKEYNPVTGIYESPYHPHTAEGSVEWKAAVLPRSHEVLAGSQ